MNDFGRQLPWLDRYLLRCDPDGTKLANAVVGHLRQVQNAGASYIVWGDSNYPEKLKTIADPPLGLTALGDLSLLNLPAVSVVGSRKASGYALTKSYELGLALAQKGIVVVSGGAFGCDIAAHHGVLSSSRSPVPAICVFAGGLERFYPVGNEAVFKRLKSRGGVFITERLWQAKCRPLDFRARNRIIAGMSGLTAVMQAAERSGALVTARRALDQGADVAVLCHPEGDVRARGGEALLAEGALGFYSAQDLIGSLDLADCALLS